jgi:hypothetical protein
VWPGIRRRGRSYGWHCIQVADEYHPEHAAENAALPPHAVYDAAFSYTVGSCRTFQHPRTDRRWALAARAWLNVIVEMIREGQRFAPGDRTDEVLEGYDDS